MVIGATFGLSWLTPLGLGAMLLVLGFLVFQILHQLALGECLGALAVMFVLLFSGCLLVVAFILSIGGEIQHAIAFWKGLKVPPDLVLSEPLRWPPRESEGPDPFRAALLGALDRPAGDDSSVVASLPSLSALAQENPALLLHYLDSSAAWRPPLSTKGKRFVTRRWRKDFEGWTAMGEDFFRPSRLENGEAFKFTFHVTLCLDGVPWRTRPPGTTPLADRPEPQAVFLTRSGRLDQSSFEVRCGHVLVEIFEETPGAERRMTKVALIELEKEFRAWRESGHFDSSLLPPGSVQREPSSLDLYDRGQNDPVAFFRFRAWVNPGEPGAIQLRVFEVTSGRTPERGHPNFQRAGWSIDAGEAFWHDGDTIFTKDSWGSVFAARAELWFKPDSGAAERKLIERLYKVQSP